MRGHGMVPLPGSDELILVARRPGDWLWRIDWRRGIVRARAQAAPDRHCYGHAVLSGDARTLFATENDVATGQGVVGIYDAGLGGYAASLAALGNRFLVSAPHGNAVAVWDSDGRAEREFGLPRPAGLAVDGDRVLVSNEHGLIVGLDPAGGPLQPVVDRPEIRWDNHLAVA